MAFLDDIFGGLFGSNQPTVQRYIPDVNQLLSQSYGTAIGLAPQVAALNQAYQPIVTGSQLANQEQIFGTQANELQQATFQKYLDNLRNPISPALIDLVNTNVLQRLGTSGVGPSEAGLNLARRSLLSFGRDFEREALEDAFRAQSSLPTSRFAYQPMGLPDVGSIYQSLSDVGTARSLAENEAEAIRKGETQRLLQQGIGILGAAGGAFLGSAGGPLGAIAGAGIGSQVGSQVGGALIGGPSYGIGAGGSPFGSLLRGFGGFGSGFGGGLGFAGLSRGYTGGATGYNPEISPTPTYYGGAPGRA